MPNNPCLASIQGVSRFERVEVLNLKENCIVDIREVGELHFLREIDLTSNLICSLKGIEKCLQLEKLVAYKNNVNTFEGISEFPPGAKLSYVDLAKNKLNDLKNLKSLSKLTNLKELYLEKKNGSNPFCSDRNKYYRFLNDYVVCECPNIEKIDGKIVS